MSETNSTTASRQATALDLILLLALSTLWGASSTFIKIGVATIPPLTLIAARTLIAGAVVLCWMRARRIAMPTGAGVWRRLSVQALLNSVFPFTLIAWAARSVDASLATILNSTSPVFALLATWFITRHEHIAPRKLLGVISGLVGICLVVGVSALDGLGHQLVPQLALVTAAVCYAAAAIYGRSFHELAPAATAAGSLVAGAIVLVPVSLLVDRPWTLYVSWQSLMALLALSILSTAIALVIYFRLVQTIGAVGVTAQAYLRVPIGVGIGMAFLGESLSGSGWLGLGCVVVGVAAMTLPSTKPGKRNAGR